MARGAVAPKVGEDQDEWRFSTRNHDIISEALRDVWGWLGFPHGGGPGADLLDYSDALSKEKSLIFDRATYTNGGDESDGQ